MTAALPTHNWSSL